MRIGRGEEAVSYARAALQLDEAVGDVVSMLFDKLNLSSALIVAREYEEALTCATAALAQAEAIHHAFLVCGLSACAAESSFYLNRLADAEQHAEHALSLEEEAFRPYALSVLGWVREAQGRYADACAWLAQAIESARQIGDRYAEAQALLALGRAQLSAGEDRAGRATLNEAAQAFSALNLPAEAERVHQLLGLSA